MDDFLRFIDGLSSKLPIRIEISHSGVTDWVMDWCITVYKQGGDPDYKESLICHAQDSDMELCFAKAHVEVKHWMRVHVGGY